MASRCCCFFVFVLFDKVSRRTISRRRSNDANADVCARDPQLVSPVVARSGAPHCRDVPGDLDRPRLRHRVCRSLPGAYPDCSQRQGPGQRVCVQVDVETTQGGVFRRSSPFPVDVLEQPIPADGGDSVRNHLGLNRERVRTQAWATVLKTRRRFVADPLVALRSLPGLVPIQWPRLSTWRQHHQLLRHIYLGRRIAEKLAGQGVHRRNKTCHPVPVSGARRPVPFCQDLIG